MEFKLEKAGEHLGIIRSDVAPRAGEYVSYFDVGGTKHTDKIASVVHDVTGPLESGQASSMLKIVLE